MSGGGPTSYLWCRLEKKMCWGYMGRNCLDPQEEKKGLLHLQANWTGKQGIMTKIFSGPWCWPEASGTWCKNLFLCDYTFKCLLCTVLLDSALLPFPWVWGATTIYNLHTFSLPIMCWCDPRNTADEVGQVVKKAAQTLCILGPFLNRSCLSIRNECSGS